MGARPDVLTVRRPWGHFDQLSAGVPVTVKTITVQPGHRLSLQRHRHRGELWQVLDDGLEVTVDDRTWPASPGELVWIPAGRLHRLGNTGVAPARVVEVAFGQVEEGDIERTDDDYDRHLEPERP
ncbi:phosphomannose isomerase type II C-terminal cupin domain [Ornithinicoccus halotolerans]|uniref:phosphomannose isomerase type II C-terminal cupin domain n=1 Tax=Ornithinicoccus halotolerans TaxID=1748220 RepID=UPI001E476123|nr:phosphomannose isomerase type II C-terminal cupin domain [Ornithinicoccus halotolerans]